MIKAIAMDMDGTLLNHENHISKETKEILMEVQKQGMMLILASGRSYPKLMPYAKELKMDQYGGYLVEVNGTAIYDVRHNKRVKLAQIEPEVVHEIFHYFMQYPVEIIGQTDDGMFDYIPETMMEEKKAYRKEHHMDEDIPWTAGAFHFIFDNRQGYPNLTYINKPEEIQEPVNKVSVAYHPDILENVTKQAKQDLKDRFWVGLTSPRWLEIMEPGVSKATGLAYVSKLTGIPLSEMMAFGDGENDMEMIREVGVGVAMGNAFDSVKAIADAVTSSNEENGIKEFVKKYFDL